MTVVVTLLGFLVGTGFGYKLLPKILGEFVVAKADWDNLLTHLK